MSDVHLSPPPPPPAPSAANLVDDGAPGAQDKPFYESFTDAANKEWATKAGFKSAEDVAALARKFDAFKDADPASLVKLPGADAKPEEFIALAERLGAPKDGTAYKLTEIEGADKPLAEWAQGAFAKAGILPWQAQLLAQEQMQFDKARAEGLVKEDALRAEREMASLQQQWGSEFKPRQEGVRRAVNWAAREAGVDADQAKAFLGYLESGSGLETVYKMFNAFSRFIKESDLVDGSPTGEEKHVLGRGWYDHPDNKR